MAQPPPPTGSAAARSALAQKLSGVPPDYFVIKLYQMLREQADVIACVAGVLGAPLEARAARECGGLVGGIRRAGS